MVATVKAKVGEREGLVFRVFAFYGTRPERLIQGM
jgi:hypothetical protein